MLFILIGLISGILSGMGLGGVLIPLLSLLSVTQKSAQLINVIAFILMTILVTYINVKNKLVEIFPSIIFAFFGVLSSLFFSFVACLIDEKILRTLFGIFLCFMALTQLISFVLKYKK